MEHAIVAAFREPEFLNVDQPFSGFKYVEETFGGCVPVHRIFSQARAAEMRSLVSEEIPPAGLIADENDEIKGFYKDHSMDKLVRLTFWATPINSLEDVAKADPEAFLGYAIVKQDTVAGRKWRWHVFEAVMLPEKRYPYRYVPCRRRFDVHCGGHPLQISGVLYCQQNNLNKACAQVALRSLLSLHVDPATVSYRIINGFAARVSGQFDLSEGCGLEAQQMREVLDKFAIRYTDIDYTTLKDEEERSSLVYQKFVYAGIESGAGALLGFRLDGPHATGSHIIPFFGHTFNRDTWVPNADMAYFHVGAETRYVPSELWVSSFVGHDDNFGSNYGVPRLYITPEQVEYVVSLYPKDVRYSGVEAEAIAVNMLYSVRNRLIPNDFPWHRWALDAIDNQRVILRPVSVSKEDYIDYLRNTSDWDRNKESTDVCNDLEALLPSTLWLIELSVFELFPSNLRKFGDILLDASIEVDPNDEAHSFVLARVPGSYIVQGSDSDGMPKFTSGPSSLTSHTPIYMREYEL